MDEGNLDSHGNDLVEDFGKDTLDRKD